VESIFDTITQINKEGTTVLLVEQNALMALSIANRGYVMQTGEIVLHDKAAELKQNKMIQNPIWEWNRGLVPRVKQNHN